MIWKQNAEHSSEAADHDQTKREFRNFKRLAATKGKALDALRAEHSETLQSLRRTQTNVESGLPEEQGGETKLEKLVAVQNSMTAKPEAGNGETNKRRSSGPSSKKHRRVR